jgi:hypothetical protein
MCMHNQSLDDQGTYAAVSSSNIVQLVNEAAIDRSMLI